jgi:hypothetical protein
MLLDSKQREFIDKVVLERKSVYTAAKEMNIPVAKLIEWYDDLFDEIARLKTEQTITIIEEYDLSQISELEYYAKLQKKLKTELNDRDFSGLPTDKLYLLLSDIRSKIDNILGDIGNKENDWEDEFLDDEFYDDDDF